VEEQRGGRLAKLDELAANLKRLEPVALDNSIYLDENLCIHALWSALRAVNNAIDAPVQLPFRDELRVLPHASATRDDAVVGAVLSRSMRATQQTVESSLWRTLRRGSRRASRLCRMRALLCSLMSPRMCCRRSPSAARDSFLVTMS